MPWLAFIYLDTGKPSPPPSLFLHAYSSSALIAEHAPVGGEQTAQSQPRDGALLSDKKTRTMATCEHSGNRNGITLHKRSQSPEVTHCEMPFMWHSGKDQLYCWMTEGRLPGMRAGGRVLYERTTGGCFWGSGTFRVLVTVVVTQIDMLTFIDAFTHKNVNFTLFI